MPYLSTQGPRPKIGKPFNAMLDDGHSRTGLPVSAVQTSDRWIRIGADDWRQVRAVVPLREWQDLFWHHAEPPWRCRARPRAAGLGGRAGRPCVAESVG